MGSGAAVAVVTGAANGIGAAVALRLREDGFAVAAADVEPVERPTGSCPAPWMSPTSRRTIACSTGSRPSSGP